MEFDQGGVADCVQDGPGHFIVFVAHLIMDAVITLTAFSVNYRIPINFVASKRIIG